MYNGIIAIQMTQSTPSGTYNAVTLESEGGATITYTVQREEENVFLNDIALTVNHAISSKGEATLAFVIADDMDIMYSGNYKGIVTFTVSIAAVSTISLCLNHFLRQWVAIIALPSEHHIQNLIKKHIYYGDTHNELF